MIIKLKYQGSYDIKWLMRVPRQHDFIEKNPSPNEKGKRIKIKHTLTRVKHQNVYTA